MRKGILILAICSLFAFGTSGAVRGSDNPSSNHVSGSVVVYFNAHGLTPGDEYGATFTSYASDSDTHPYVTRISPDVVDENGNITFYVPTTFLSRHYAASLDKVEECLTNGYSYAPALDSDGLEMCTTVEVGQYN